MSRLTASPTLVRMTVSVIPDGALIATRRQLLARGYTPKQLAAGVRAGSLLRIRRGYYAARDVHPLIQHAVRIGGLLTCVSAASLLGIWVHDSTFAHVSLRHEASRMRSPRDRFVPLTEDNRFGCVLHWWPLVDKSAATMHRVAAVDALAHLIRCQPEFDAVAALDSSLHEKVITNGQLDTIFDAVPERFRQLRKRIDGRAMSGLETRVRLLAIDAGLRCAIQVKFDGIGTVDLVIEGCLVVETDGHNGHDDAVSAARDYDRDLALIALGYIVLRFNYRQVMYEPDRVMAAILAALRTHRGAARF